MVDPDDPKLSVPDNNWDIRDRYQVLKIGIFSP